MYSRVQWRLAQDALNAANVDGEFVTFVAFEYTNSGDTTNRVPGYGHKCVIFRDASVVDDPIASDASGATEYAPSANELWSMLAGYQCLTIPHHSAKGVSSHETNSTINMSTDWDQVNAAFQPAVEIFSIHPIESSSAASWPNCSL